MALIDRVKKLKEAYDNNQIPRLAKHEVNPNLPKDDRLNYIYFTLPVSINFQRSSPAMWQAALDTFNDKETNFLFYPEIVAKSTREDVQKALLKNKLGLQKNKHTDIWFTLAQTLNQYYDNDPRNILIAGEYDVVKILKLLNNRKKLFPYLSGLKISNYWLFILMRFTDLKLSNIEEISIIPDTHVIKSSRYLGLTTEKTSLEELVLIWKNLLKDSGLKSY